MISTLTVSGSLIVSGGLTVNQLARKGNLVVHLDASPSTYTAYNFNSGSRNGTSASILDWPNRWTDLSGNNNHAFPITCSSTGLPNLSNNGILLYTSSAFPFISSSLNNSVNVNTWGSSSPNRYGALRLNPIQETTGPLSVFLWVRPKNNTALAQNFYINKRSNVTSLIPGVGCQWQINGGTSAKFYGSVSYTGSIINFAVASSSATYSNNIWYNVGFTLTGPNVGDTITLYVNGKQDGIPTTLTNNVIFGSRQIIIGRNDWASTSNMMNADLSQVLIYNTCLTPQEVQNNYQITKYKHQT